MSEPYYGAPPPKKALGVLAWLGIGCAVVIGGTIAFVTFILFVTFGAMRNSTPFEEATGRARRDPRVIAALGEPIDVDLLFQGNISTHNRDGNADLNIGLSGPKGKARLIVVGTKTAGKWTYGTMRVDPEGGAPIDLLVQRPAGTRSEGRGSV